METTIEGSSSRLLSRFTSDFNGAADKFSRCAARVLERSRADAIVAAVSDLERLADVAELAELIGPESKP